jgi:hypothetical protein
VSKRDTLFVIVVLVIIAAIVAFAVWNLESRVRPVPVPPTVPPTVTPVPPTKTARPTDTPTLVPPTDTPEPTFTATSSATPTATDAPTATPTITKQAPTKTPAPAPAPAVLPVTGGRSYSEILLFGFGFLLGILATMGLVLLALFVDMKTEREQAEEPKRENTCRRLMVEGFHYRDLPKPIGFRAPGSRSKDK